MVKRQVTQAGDSNAADPGPQTLPVSTPSADPNEELRSQVVPAPIPPAQVALLAPQEGQQRGRQTLSTQRDPSLFETVRARVKRQRVWEAASLV